MISDERALDAIATLLDGITWTPETINYALTRLSPPPSWTAKNINDALTHRTKTQAVTMPDGCAGYVTRCLMRHSQSFEYVLLPDGECEIVVKDDDARLPDQVKAWVREYLSADSVALRMARDAHLCEHGYIRGACYDPECPGHSTPGEIRIKPICPARKGSERAPDPFFV